MTKTIALMLSAALAACAGATDVRYSGGVVVRSPELVSIDPDVYVVADADEPVFYTDNYYWLYRDGGWFRSTSYRGGWVRYHETPYRLRRIDQPYAYVRFRDRGARATYRDRYDNRGPYDGRYYDRSRGTWERDDRNRDPYRAYPPGQVTPTRPEPYRPPAPNPRPPQQQPPVEPEGPTTPDQRVTPGPHSDTPADVRDRDHDRGRPADQRAPDRVPPQDRGPDRDAGSPDVDRPTTPPDRGAPADRGGPDRVDQDRGRGNDEADRGRRDKDRRDKDRRDKDSRERRDRDRDR